MDFCNDASGGFQSSVISNISGGGSDPDTTKWNARRINLSMSDVQQSIQEGRAVGTPVWDVEGNPQIAANN